MTARDAHLESWSQQLGHLMANLRGVQDDLHMLKVEVDQSTKAEHADTFTPDIEVDLTQAMEFAREYIRNGYIEQAYETLTAALELAKSEPVPLEPVAIFEGTVAIGEGLPYRGNGRIKKLKFIPVGAELYLKRGAA